MNSNKSKGRIIQGVVVKKKMQKSIVVCVNRKVKHKLYKKFITRSTKLHAHDEKILLKKGILLFYRNAH